MATKQLDILKKGLMKPKLLTQSRNLTWNQFLIFLFNSSSAINPILTSDPVAEVEKQVEAALDDLIIKGAIQPCDHMDIENLLNPAGESQDLTESSDEENFQSVLDAIEAREKIDINGGDDVDDGLDVEIEPQPTRHKVFKAV